MQDRVEGLIDAFWRAAALSERKQSALFLAQQAPERAWEVFTQALETSHPREAACGFAALGDKKAIPLLSRAYARGGNELIADALIEALAALEAVEWLCDIAEDSFTPTGVRLSALRALSGFPCERTLSLFLSELGASSLQRQQLAIEVLGCWRVRSAVPLLTRRLRRQRLTRLRGPLMEALARIGTDDALVAVQQLLQESQPEQMLDHIAVLAHIPQHSLIGVLEGCREMVDGELERRLDEAIETLQTTIRAHLQAQLAPYTASFEDALF